MSEARNRRRVETKVTQLPTPRRTKKTKKLWDECPYFDYTVKLTRVARNWLATYNKYAEAELCTEDLVRVICADFYLRTGGKPMTGTSTYALAKPDTGTAVGFEPQDGTVYVYMSTERSNYQNDHATTEHREDDCRYCLAAKESEPFAVELAATVH